ncbi:MAG TPA: winged helix-turn-helix domain-containing protein [Pyrinomonadaceae bacterium]|jgi:DNA-binding winged helix-turn-helix (wHTH) protein/tetratricopeptide (TPR) repeat protein|nr:winged helix-turn-helix domain-containing protein [Pyrinomonadaceae bacterium]
MPHHNSHSYEFGPYRLDVGQRVLTRTGEAVSLTPKATEILTLLVANAGQLVGKDELLKQVWPDTFVEESNLTQNIFLLRRVLGDERPSPRYIETVVRRGYRFIANVRVIAPTELQGSQSPGAPEDMIARLTRGEDGAHGNSHHSRSSNVQRSSLSLQFGSVDEAAGPRIVAVLPFLNATGNDDLEYLADGLTDNLVNNLSRVSKLRVMSRSAVFRYKAKKQLDPRGIGKELGVSVVLVGTLTSRGESLGITVELVEVMTGWQLWGDSFDCQLKDILELQDRITRQLLNALKLNLTNDEEKRITARYTESAEAYQSYLEARYHWSKYTRQGIEKAILHFRYAIELDSNYALAYAGIIDCYLRLATNYLPPEEDLRRLEAFTSPEPTKGGNSRDAYDDFSTDQTKANLKLRFEWDWKAAERELRRASELKTDYPAAHQWYAAYSLAKDIFEESRTSVNNRTTDSACKLPYQVLSGEPTPAEHLQVLCAVAREQIAITNYAAAELILAPWYSETKWPDISSLTTHAAADLLFTLGALIGCLSGTRQMPNGQKRAEAFLNGSVALFSHVGLKSRAVEAQAELARCYYRQGLFDLARQTFTTALSELPLDQNELKSLCLVFLGAVERDSGRLMNSLSILREANSLQTPGRLGTGRCELELATTLKELAVCEGQHAYNDEALLNYANALRECEGIGNHRLAAVVENNLGFFLLSIGFLKESEQHLSRARRFFEAISDFVRRAQVNETLTRLYIATNRYSLAKETIEDALQTLEMTDAEAILSEALTTSGIVSSRLGHSNEAQNRFEEAYKVAERCGDREGARRALVSKFEEMGDELERDELLHVWQKLQRLLAVAEPSTLGGRVEETIVEIGFMLDQEHP